jgi:conjugal transfer ATP-binding protein TraC
MFRKASIKLGERVAKIFGEGSASYVGISHFQEACKNMASFYKIADLLPYESFDEETKIFHNQSSLGFVIETLPLVGASEEMQKEISNLFTMMLPDGSSLQVILWADPHIGNRLDSFLKARESSTEVLQELSQKRVDYLKKFAHTSPFKPYVLRNFRIFLCFSMERSLSMRKDQDLLVRLQNQISTTLEMLNLPVLTWEPENLLSTLEGFLHLNPSSVQVPCIQWNRLQPLADQLCCADNHLVVEQNGLSMGQGDVCMRTYSVRQFPFVWSLHAMGELIGDMDRDQAQISCPFFMHYGVHIPKQDNPKTKVLAKATYVEKQAFSPIGKYLPDIQREAEELSFVREQIGKGERIVQTQFGVVLYSTPQDVESAEQTLMNLFTAKEWKLEPNRFLHLPLFLSNLPMMWGEGNINALLNLKKLKTTLSTESSNLLPLQGEWQGTQTPGMLLCGRRGQIFSWYPFDNSSGNYNVCVVGRSGSGKSVFMQELMTSTLGLGGRVFVLDVGRSFEKTCFLLEGQFIEFTPKTPLCLNPFSTIPADNDEVAEDALAMLKSIFMLMAAPSQGVDDKGAALLEQAMLETWAVYRNEATVTHVAEWLAMHQDSKAKDLGQMLFPYTKNGTYGRFFQGISTVNFKNQLVVVELEELKERKDLQAVIVQMVIINITNQMFLGDRQTPFHIVFDEAWDMLRGSQSGVFIETLARRLRKYGGSLIVGTQSVNDFFVNPGAQAAFDNSDWMCFLSQKPESIEQLKKTNRLSLSPQKESLLKSVKTRHGQYAEAMISGSTGYAIGRLLLDPFSSLLYSTKAEDYSAIQSLKAQGFSIQEAIQALNTQRQGRGDV